MKRIVMVILMSAFCSQQALAVLNDIECKVSKVAHDGTREVIVKKQSVPDFNDSEKEITIDLKGTHVLSLGCESVGDKLFTCGIRIGEKGQMAKDFGTLELSHKNGVWVTSDGVFDVMTKNYAVSCSSIELFMKRSEDETKPAKRKARTLSEDELSFCERFRKRSESSSFGVNGDNRLLCISTLQAIEKPVPSSQLDFCAQFDRDAEGFGVDTRLNCILKVATGR